MFSALSDVMNAPVAVFRPVERIGRIVNTLKTETFCGFPVTEAQPDAVSIKRLLFKYKN